MRSWTCRRFVFLDVLVSIKSVLGRRPPSSILSNPEANGRPLFRSGLANLLLKPFARVAHALVLIRIRRTQRPHLRSYLANLLPVDSANRKLGLLRIDGGVDSVGQRIFDGM